MSNLTQCSICGETYAYCPNCSSTHAWKFYTDKYECYQVFMILKQYYSNPSQIDKREAMNMLENIGITDKSDLSIYKPKIANKIKNILAVEQQVEIKPIEEKTVLKKAKKSKLYNNE